MAGGVGEWVAQHADPLWRYALSKVRDPAVAEELVQETFVAALASAKDGGGFTGEGGATQSTWLIGILRHKVMDHYRKAGRAGPGLGAFGSPEDIENHAQDIHGRMFTKKGLWQKEQVRLAKQAGLDYSDQQAFTADLSACAEGLPPGAWEAFVMREAQGVESGEICKQLGITPTNLWTRLHRARAALRDCLVKKGWWGAEGHKAGAAGEARNGGKK